MSLSAIVSPLVFTAGMFGYFTSERAVVHLPGAPFYLGSLLLLAALVVIFRVFRRIPETPPKPAEHLVD
jgi:DHA1 family tetracycline resistance protein-like MFS transporter